MPWILFTWFIDLKEGMGNKRDETEKEHPPADSFAKHTQNPGLDPIKLSFSYELICVIKDTVNSYRNFISSYYFNLSPNSGGD